MKTVPNRQSAFTLIEILVVLALLGLIATMLPKGLDSLFSRSTHQALVQATAGAARDCSIVAQQQQRSYRLGSQFCPLPSKLGEVYESEAMPIFHADGTASHTAHIAIQSERGRVSVIAIDKLTSNISVKRNAKI